MPVRSHFQLLSEKYTSKIFEIQDQIQYFLDSKSPADWDKADELTNKLANGKGFDTEIERQLIIIWKAQLNELKQTASPSHTMSLVDEGIALTYKEFDHQSFEGNMLIFGEAKLLHIYALALSREGKISEAITLLRRIQKGISLLPEDDHDKEKQLAPILLSLSNLLMLKGKYGEALKVCLLGNSSSTERNEGKYMPDFLYNMARCNGSLGNTVECHRLFQLSYFCYVLMRKMDQANQLKCYAKKQYNVELNTYGVENLVFEELDTLVRHGASVERENIGLFISALRQEEGISQDELWDGICGQSTFSRIEAGKRKGKIFCLEAIMQRLGRDINKYFATFPSIDDFMDKQTRNDVISRLASLDFEVAAKLLEKLKGDRKSYKSGVGLQFIKMSEATIFANQNVKGYSSPKYLEMLENALKVTMSKFDENRAGNYRLSYYEVSIINQMAIHYCESGKTRQGLRLFERLIDSMNCYYIDEKEKIRMYTTVLYNYSKYLGLTGRFEEALEVVKEGEILELRHRRLTLLPSFAINHAYNLLELGLKEQSVPYFALSYYGSIAFEEEYNYPVIATYVKERFGITFDYLPIGLGEPMLLGATSS